LLYSKLESNSILIEDNLLGIKRLRFKLKFKIKYHVVFDMDYGSSTKRYGDYVLDSEDVLNNEDAEKKMIELFNDGDDPDLNPYFNFTRGKILSKKIVIDDLEKIIN